MTESRRAIEAVFREEYGLVLSGLVSYTGDIQLAEDALQDAFVAALGVWHDDIPRNPAAWLTTAARRKAIDRIRRSKLRDEKYQLLAHDQQDDTDVTDDEVVPDERLRLIFTCCHPALAAEARVALTLKTVGGLTTAEIARAFITSESTMAQRLVRAKRKIKAAGIPYRVPDSEDLPERLPAVLAVLYLIFNEGYTGLSDPNLVRHDLMNEAIRLASIVAALLPDEPEVKGLAALMRLHHARSAARLDGRGDLVLLGDQDRTRWNRTEIEDATAMLESAMASGTSGPYQIQAAIAALHANAPSSADTDWQEIVMLYQSLRRFVDTPVVRLNQAVAVAMASDAASGLRLVDGIEGLERYSYFHAARGTLLAEQGRDEDAREAFLTAIDLTTSPPERRLLESKLTGLG